MSHTLHLSWPHTLAVHAPTMPRWLVNSERAVGEAVHRMAADHPASPVYEGHVDYIEDALMSREMYRL